VIRSFCITDAGDTIVALRSFLASRGSISDDDGGLFEASGLETLRSGYEVQATGCHNNKTQNKWSPIHTWRVDEGANIAH
jgi:hypothetical protein